MLLLTYISFHAIYIEMDQISKASLYLNKLIMEIQSKSENNYSMFINLRYYMSMHLFSIHNFIQSKQIMKELLKIDISCCKNFILPYFHMINETDEINNFVDYFKELQNENPIKKIFSKYFLMKFKKVKKLKLRDYLLKRIVPVINVENVFECHILVGELFQLGFIESAFLISDELCNKGFKFFPEWLVFIKK